MKVTYPKLAELELRNKRVFIRVDFNVPLKLVGETYQVSDARRIEEALPTIRHVIEQGGKVILGSHLGRPKGQFNLKYSLEPVGSYLSSVLGKDVLLTEDCVGDAPRGLSHQMRAGDVMLLENLRFHPGEEENSSEFANKLAELCDVYVSDAFGTMHRAHASTDGLPRLTKNRAIGLLVEKELKYLSPLKENPKRPFLLLMGGSKVSDKIGVLEYFLPKVDTLVIGGAMAYSFLNAKGFKVGKSICEDKQVQLAKKIIRRADARNVRLVLPEDHVVSLAFGDTQNVSVTQGIDISDDKMGLDIGPKTIAKIEAALETAETIFWNGPMGVFEEPVFAKGTFEVAKLIAKTKAVKLVGGGDSAAAITKAGLDSFFDFISTGGGATLEYLEGKNLPGLKVLEIIERT
ncbi:MAG: phosphoglycerate kinase [Deltaproteobacteria bacterium]|nr:phosphoglycerate kinase [Deltaproteobacteria bacterium]